MDENENVTEDVEDEDSEGGTQFRYSEEGNVEYCEEEVFDVQDMSNAPESQWSVQTIWNETVDVERREPKIRDYISFSDIGKKDYWSRYMKMNGVPESNPFDPRVLRIFQAGDEFHNLIKTVFKKAGIFINSQDDLDSMGMLQMSEIPATEKTLKQYGAYDALVGGKVDRDKALEWVAHSDLSPYVKVKVNRLIDTLTERFPNGLQPLLYEVKSVNSQAFWGRKNYLQEAYPHHQLQAFGYLRANHTSPKALDMVRKAGVEVESIDEARVLYVSKDDLTMAEFPIRFDNQVIADKYDRDILEMSYYILNKVEPPKPQYVIFNPRKTHSFTDKKIKYKVKGCYEVNWEVSRSPYFTLMTGFKTEKEFQESVKEELKEKNKAIKANVLQKVALKTKQIPEVM